MYAKLLAAALTLVAPISAGKVLGQAPRVAWSEMERFFAPPAEFAGKLGDFRSVLRFDDGSMVETAKDWPRRRAEILKYWHGVLGEWPPLVEKPRIRYGRHEHVENFTRHEIEIEVAADRFVASQYLLVPDGDGPFPAVVVPWYNAADGAGLNDKQRDRTDYGYQLAKRGFVALCIGEIGPVRSPTVDKDRIQPLSYLAYAAANCSEALAHHDKVDPKRIGIVGHSFGGKWTMFASCLHERFACAVWGDPSIVWNEKDANANYWEKWYLGYEMGRPAEKQREPGVPSGENPRTGAYKRLVDQGRDLHELHALMAPRPFLVSGGGQDRPVHWTALNHTITVNELLGHERRVAMTMRDGHSPTAEANAQVYAFFEHFLKRE
ncbi:MAG: sialidase [Planctomycetota bacterium]|nr:MAG: sialidase [Planctomycetota bacterium]